MCDRKPEDDYEDVGIAVDAAGDVDVAVAIDVAIDVP